MRAYVTTTGTLFGLVTLAHILRIVQESRALATDPWFALLTVASAALCVWALRLLRVLPAKQEGQRRSRI